MAGQGFFFKATNLFSNSRFLLNNRLPLFNQVSGIRQKAIDKLKDLKVPEKPKRPLTAYFKFASDHRNSIIKQHPDWKITQIAIQCANDWKTIDPSTKSKYENESKLEMDEFAKKYLAYMNSLTEEQKEALEEYKKELKQSKHRREQRKKNREADKPKRPMGSYMLYVKEQAQLGSDKTFIQLMGHLKETWADMPETEKSKYTLAAAKAKEQYDVDLKQWENRMIGEGRKDLVRQSTLLGKSPKKPSQKSQKNK